MKLLCGKLKVEGAAFLRHWKQPCFSFSNQKFDKDQEIVIPRLSF